MFVLLLFSATATVAATVAAAAATAATTAVAVTTVAPVYWLYNHPTPHSVNVIGPG